MKDYQPWSALINERLEQSPSKTVNLGEAHVEVVRSESYDHLYYYIIDLRNEGRSVCTCPGYRYADHCKHTRIGTNS